MTARFEESELIIDDELVAAGGTADILRCTWPGGTGLYKRYKTDFLSKIDEVALTRLVRWRLGLAQDTRRKLDRSCAWPIASVVRDGRTVGVLMPRTPAGLATSSPGAGDHRCRTLSDLRRLQPDLPADQIRPAIAETLTAFGLTVQVVLWLHEQGVVVNDVQPLNVLINLDIPQVYLVDCDAMVGPWGQVGPPAAPVYFNEIIKDPPGPAVDLAKVAWCMFFTLLDDFSLRQLGPEVQEQIERYSPHTTVDLLVRTASGREDVSRLREPWSERASQWISCGANEVLITDDGWHPVSAKLPLPPPRRSAELPPTVPWRGRQEGTTRTAAPPTVPLQVGRARPPDIRPGQRPARRWPNRRLAIGALVLVGVILAMVAGVNFMP
jgi:hypothetical protein